MRPAHSAIAAAMLGIAALGGGCAEAGGGTADADAVGGDVTAGDTQPHTVPLPAPTVPEELWRLPSDAGCEDANATWLGTVWLPHDGDLSGIRCVLGDVRVDGSETLTVALPDLRVIRGDLRIGFNAALTQVELPALVYVGGDLQVIGNGALAEFMPGALRTIAGELMVTDNDALARLEVPALRAIGEGVDLRANASLALLPLGSVVAVSGPVTIGDNPTLESVDLVRHGPLVTGPLDVSNNRTLTRLGGLDHVPAVPQRIVISQNPALAQLRGFGMSEGIHIALEALPALTTTDAFADLTQVGTLHLERTGLSDLRAFSALQHAGAIDIIANHLLTEIAGLDALAEVANTWRIRNNDALAVIEGPPALAAIGHLLITHNDTLEAIGGFDALDRIGGVLELAQLETLTDIGGIASLRTVQRLVVSRTEQLADLEPLTALTTASTLEFSKNDALTALPALPNLNSASGPTSVDVRDNPALNAVGGFPGLTEIHALVIEDNPVLATLAGLDTIRGVTERVSIRGNDALGDHGLWGLRDVTSGNAVPLRIRDNGALPACLVEVLIDRLRAGGWAGQVITDGNLAGCTCNGTERPRASCP